MKIKNSVLSKLIKEVTKEYLNESDAFNAKTAIAQSQSKMREDGLSFEAFIDQLLNYLEDRTGAQYSEEDLADDYNYYDEWLAGVDPYSLGAEYLADYADTYLQENKMKISKSELKKLIKEVAEPKLNEDDVQMQPGGNWGQPLPGEEEAGMRDVESLAMDIVQLLEGIEHNDAVDALTLAAETLGLTPPEEEKRPIGFREGKALPPHWLEQGIKADPMCDEKVPNGASMGEYKKCLKNPAAYQRPARRSLEEALRHKLLEESLKRALANALKK